MTGEKAARVVFPAAWETLAVEWDDPAQTESKQVAGHILLQIIRHGTLKPHDELPSDEFLMEELTVSRGSVRRAKALLAERGIAEITDGRYFVRCPAPQQGQGSARMDDAGIDKLTTEWADEDMPLLARVAGDLLRRMRAGEIRKGGPLPTNADFSRKLGTGATVISYAKQLLLCLGLAGKGSGGYTSLVEPRPGGRPDAAKILAWQHDGSMTERIMADLADQIATGRLARGAELPDPETLQAQWECETVRPPTQALQRLVAYPGLVTLDGGRYFVT